MGRRRIAHIVDIQMGVYCYVLLKIEKEEEMENLSGPFNMSAKYIQGIPEIINQIESAIGTFFEFDLQECTFKPKLDMDECAISSIIQTIITAIMRILNAFAYLKICDKPLFPGFEPIQASAKIAIQLPRMLAKPNTMTSMVTKQHDAKKKSVKSCEKSQNCCASTKDCNNQQKQLSCQRKQQNNCESKLYDPFCSGQMTKGLELKILMMADVIVNILSQLKGLSDMACDFNLSLPSFDFPDFFNFLSKYLCIRHTPNGPVVEVIHYNGVDEFDDVMKRLNPPYIPRLPDIYKTRTPDIYKTRTPDIYKTRTPNPSGSIFVHDGWIVVRDPDNVPIFKVPSKNNIKPTIPTDADLLNGLVDLIEKVVDDESGDITNYVPDTNCHIPMVDYGKTHNQLINEMCYTQPLMGYVSYKKYKSYVQYDRSITMNKSHRSVLIYEADDKIQPPSTILSTDLINSKAVFEGKIRDKSTAYMVDMDVKPFIVSGIVNKDNKKIVKFPDTYKIAPGLTNIMFFEISDKMQHTDDIYNFDYDNNTIEFKYEIEDTINMIGVYDQNRIVKVFSKPETPHTILVDKSQFSGISIDDINKNIVLVEIDDKLQNKNNIVRIVEKVEKIEIEFNGIIKDSCYLVMVRDAHGFSIDSESIEVKTEYVCIKLPSDQMKIDRNMMVNKVLNFGTSRTDAIQLLNSFNICSRSDEDIQRLIEVATLNVSVKDIRNANWCNNGDDISIVLSDSGKKPGTELAPTDLTFTGKTKVDMFNLPKHPKNTYFSTRLDGNGHDNKSRYIFYDSMNYFMFMYNISMNKDTYIFNQSENIMRFKGKYKSFSCKFIFNSAREVIHPKYETQDLSKSFVNVKQGTPTAHNMLDGKSMLVQLNRDLLSSVNSSVVVENKDDIKHGLTEINAELINISQHDMISVDKVIGEQQDNNAEISIIDTKLRMELDYYSNRQPLLRIANDLSVGIQNKRIVLFKGDNIIEVMETSLIEKDKDYWMDLEFLDANESDMYMMRITVGATDSKVLRSMTSVVTATDIDLVFGADSNYDNYFYGQIVKPDIRTMYVGESPSNIINNFIRYTVIDLPEYLHTDTFMDFYRRPPNSQYKSVGQFGVGHIDYESCNDYGLMRVYSMTDPIHSFKNFYCEEANGETFALELTFIYHNTGDRENRTILNDKNNLSFYMDTDGNLKYSSSDRVICNFENTKHYTFTMNYKDLNMWVYIMDGDGNVIGEYNEKKEKTYKIETIGSRFEYNGFIEPIKVDMISMFRSTNVITVKNTKEYMKYLSFKIRK